MDDIFPFSVRTQGCALPRVDGDQTYIAPFSPNVRLASDSRKCRAERRLVFCNETRAQPVPFGTVLRDGATIGARMATQESVLDDVSPRRNMAHGPGVGSNPPSGFRTHTSPVSASAHWLNPSTNDTMRSSWEDRLDMSVLQRGTTHHVIFAAAIRAGVSSPELRWGSTTCEHVSTQSWLASAHLGMAPANLGRDGPRWSWSRPWCGNPVAGPKSAKIRYSIKCVASDHGSTL